MSVSTEKVALFSKRNIHWAGVGKLFTGYNIVTKEEAEKWLTNSSVRVADPEEIAARFN